MRNIRYYKVLDKENRSCHGGNPDLPWRLPIQNRDGSWTPGNWMPKVQGDLELCENGYHLTDAQHLPEWLNANIYEAEPSKEIIVGDNNVVCRSVRLLKKTSWDDHLARLFACDCAERLLPLYERDCPDDSRPRRALEVARLYLDGKVDKRELIAARDNMGTETTNIEISLYPGTRSIADTIARMVVRVAVSNSPWFVSEDAMMAAKTILAKDAKYSAMGITFGEAWRLEDDWQVQRLLHYLEE